MLYIPRGNNNDVFTFFKMAVKSQFIYFFICFELKKFKFKNMVFAKSYEVRKIACGNFKFIANLCC